MRIRKDITNEMIKNALRSNKGNVHRTAKELDCSRTIIHKVKKGKRKDPPHILQNIDGLCTCCGHRPVWKDGGLEKLCKLCFKYRDRGVAEVALNYTGKID